jgi:hypothetical protein
MIKRRRLIAVDRRAAGTTQEALTGEQAMEIPTKYVDKTVLKACAMMSVDSDENFEPDDLLRRLNETLAPWAARIVDEVCDDHLALARLVAEAMALQFYCDRGELLPE